MNWFKKILNIKSTKKQDLEDDSTRENFVGLESFETGKNLYRKEQYELALNYFDKAIENGYKYSDIFSFRGHCSNYLGLYYDALEDFNKAINLNPQKGIASNYCMRSFIKDSIYDFEGSIADIKEAIRLSKLNNDDNRWWNNYAKENGYKSATEKYEKDLIYLNRKNKNNN